MLIIVHLPPLAHQLLSPDRAPGHKLPLSEIREMVLKDRDEGRIPKERRREVMEKLEQHRMVQTVGTRVSNAGAAHDMRATMAKISEEVCAASRIHSESPRSSASALQMINLNTRTGAESFGFFTRGHVHDSGIPGWIASGRSIEFLAEVLDIDPLDVSTKFEQWCTARDEGEYNLSLPQCNADRPHRGQG